MASKARRRKGAQVRRTRKAFGMRTRERSRRAKAVRKWHL